MATAVVPGNATPCGYQQLACDTAQSLTVPANARFALLKAEAQTVRIRDDGTDPTTSVGFPLLVAGEPLLYQGNLKGIRAIAAVAGGLLDILYYG
jgi:hypothetical protein